MVLLLLCTGEDEQFHTDSTKKQNNSFNTNSLALQIHMTVSVSNDLLQSHLAFILKAKNSHMV